MTGRGLMVDLCIGVGLGLFFGGAVVATDSPQVAAYLMLGAVAVSAAAKIWSDK
jgi:hypothetical protein